MPKPRCNSDEANPATKMRKTLHIARKLLCAALLAAAAPAGAAEPLGSPLHTSEDRIHERVNQRRVATGHPPLRRDAGLDAIARKHSQEMASGSVAFGHVVTE